MSAFERIPSEIFEKIPLTENRRYLADICARNRPFTAGLTAEYMAVARRRGFVEANHRIRDLDSGLKLGGTGLRASADDQEIKDYAEAITKRLAAECDGWTARAGVMEAVRWARAECERTGVPFPADDDAEPAELVAAMARIFDPAYWRRQLRTMQARIIEDVARDLRRVARDRDIYASEWTVQRRTKQRRRNLDTLANMEAENEVGQVFTLDELAERSLANPAHRRAELMTRIRGFEEVATAVGHIGVFITLTAPSRFHRMMTRAGRSFANPKWDGSTPRDAQAYHLGVWEKIRAEWHREEIRPYGFRVVEPNHDGTPHWHLLLFIEREKVLRMSTIIRRLALAVDGDENGAKKHRVTIKRMDPQNGTAAGYIAKYISKNIDGHGIEGEHAQPGEDAAANARRIEAWATTYRIRQFQQIGGPSVGVWRELRRLNDDDPQLLTSSDVQRVHQEAAAGNWAAYVLLMGGPMVKRVDQLLFVAYEETETRYHELGRRVVGVQGVNLVRTRVHIWTIQRKGESTRRDARIDIHLGSNTDTAINVSAAVSGPVVFDDGIFEVRYQAFEEIPEAELLRDAEGKIRGGTRRAVSGAGTAPPWTCVNNYNRCEK